MSGVDQVDALPRRVQELVVAQVRRHEGVAPGGDGPVLVVAAGAAAHRHTMDHLAAPGEPDAVGVQIAAYLAGKIL